VFLGEYSEQTPVVPNGFRRLRNTWDISVTRHPSPENGHRSGAHCFVNHFRALREQPLGVLPIPPCSFLRGPHTGALASLFYGGSRRQRWVSGPDGKKSGNGGKPPCSFTFLEKLRDSAPPRPFLFQSHWDPRSFLSLTHDRSGIHIRTITWGELHRKLNDAPDRELRAGRRVCGRH